MDRAVQFEQEGNKILVKYWLSLNEGGGIELHTVLEAMNVCLYFDLYSFILESNHLMKILLFAILYSWLTNYTIPNYLHVKL